MEEINIIPDLLETDNPKMSKNLRQAITDIYQCQRQLVRNDFNFLVALYNLYQLGDMKQLEYLIYCRFTKHNESMNIYQLCEKYFGLGRKYIDKCLRICYRFITWSDVAPEYTVPILNDLTLSKIMELLTLSADQINFAVKEGYIKSYSTVKELRDYVKSLKGGEKEENKVLEEPRTLDEQEAELDQAFDPKEEYDYSYYKSKSKADLIGYCIDLQRLVQKLLKKNK